MRFRRRGSIFTLLAAVLLAVAATLSAYADPPHETALFFDGEGFRYYQTSSVLCDGTNDAYQNGFHMIVDDNSYYGGTNRTLSHGGQGMSFAVQTLSGLEVQRHIYVSPTDNWYRVLDVYRNPTTSDITIPIEIYAWSDFDSEEMTMTSSGDQTFTSGDRWAVIRDTSANSEFPVLNFNYWGLGGEAANPAPLGSGFSVNCNFSLTVPYRETRSILYFTGQSWSVAEAVENAQYLDRLPDTALTGIPPSLVSTIANWDASRVLVTPEPVIEFSGYRGGPFTAEDSGFTLGNGTETPHSWQANYTSSWFSLGLDSDILYTDSQASVPVLLGSAADSFAPGTYATTVTFQSQTDGSTMPRLVRLTVRDNLKVTPESGFETQGLVGGPFAPTSQTYTLTNLDDGAVNWTAVPSRTWLSADPAAGTLNPGASVDVRVSLAASANGLADSMHTATVTFNNTTSGASMERPVAVRAYATETAGGTVGPGTLPAIEILGDNASDGFGIDLAFGDVNGDGFDDVVAMSMMGRASNWGYAPATGFVIYGHGAIRDADIDLDTDGAISPAGETRILGDGAAGLSMGSVASADMNGDGFDEVIVSCPDFDIPARSETGLVAVVFGRSDLPATTVDLATSETTPLTNAGPEFRILGDDAGDNFGNSLACGDINADGYQDLVVGARAQSDDAPDGTTGKVFVIYGSAAMTSGVLDLDTDGAIGPGGETRILGDYPDGRFGTAVASGDVNGDGYDDVIVGAYRASPGDKAKAGEVVILYGSATLPATIVDLNTGGTISAAGETRIRGGNPNDYLGASLACRDVNSDGYADVVVGAPFASPGSTAGAGASYVVYGGPTLPGTIVDLASTDYAPTANGESSFLGSVTYEMHGLGAAVTDFNGDGWGDPVFGYNNPMDGATGARLEYGGPALPGTQTDYSSDVPDVRMSSRVAAGATGAGLGVSVAGQGDMDRDGFAEAVCASVIADGSVAAGAGRALVAFGGGTATSATVIRHARADDAPPIDFGAVVRCRVDYAAGDAASVETASITRFSPTGLVGSDPVLPVFWRLQSTRTGAPSGATVTLQYTDAELGNASESALVLYGSATGTGGWTKLSPVTVDAQRNEIRVADLATNTYLAIVVEIPTPTPTPTATVTPTQTPTLTPTTPPATACFSDQQVCSIASDGHFFAGAYDLTGGTTEDSADAWNSATLTHGLSPAHWCGVYLYDYAAAAWTKALYIYDESM